MTKKIHGRHGARWVALQALYAWELTGTSLARIEEDLITDAFCLDAQETQQESWPKITCDKEYVSELLEGISTRKMELDALIVPHLDRAVEEVNPIEHAILRMALYELQERVEIPYKVIINEAIILAKQFGAQDSHKFVNGVLDKAAKVVRVREVA